MNPTSRTFRVGDRVRITNVGCDCEPFSDVCDRHQYVGDIVTIVDIYDEDGADESVSHTPRTTQATFRPSQTKGTPSGNAS